MTNSTKSNVFQNNEYLIAYGQVCSVSKFPPDRIEVSLINQLVITLLGDDCKVFLHGYMAFITP